MTRLTPFFAAALALTASHAFAQTTANSSSAAWTIPGNTEIQRILADQLAPSGVGAVVGVIEPGGQRIITWGKSGAANQRPLDENTVFQIGSLTKVFTSLLLADMVVHQEVGLEDPAASFLPAGVRMPQRGRPITLIDLSKHWSGLPAMPTTFRLDGRPNPYEALTEQDIWAFLSSYELPREPGTQEYSNIGVALLGRLLARHAGMEYEPLLAQRILVPLGLTSTSITLKRDQRARLAPGHDRFGDPVESWNLLAMPASGSLRSTAHDLLRFLAFNLSPDSPFRQAMELQRAPSRSLGWGRSTLGNEAVFAHEGGKEGYRSAMIFNPARGIGIVVLTNARSDAGPMPIARHLLYTGAELPPPPPMPVKPAKVSVPRRVLDQYTGTYQGDSLGTVIIARRDNHLLSQLVGGGVLVLWPSAAAEFFTPIGPERIEFTRDPKGVVDGFRFWNGAGWQSAVRANSQALRR